MLSKGDDEQQRVEPDEKVAGEMGYRESDG
jgi:hypothetical protein